MSGWIEIRATGPRAQKDLATTLLIVAGSSGVLEDAIDTVAGKLVSHSLWEEETREDDEDASPVRALKGYLPEGDNAALATVKSGLGGIGWTLETSFLKDTDQSEKWKKGLKPIRVKHSGYSVIVQPASLAEALLKVIDFDIELERVRAYAWRRQGISQRGAGDDLDKQQPRDDDP